MASPKEQQPNILKRVAGNPNTLFTAGLLLAAGGWVDAVIISQSRIQDEVQKTLPPPIASEVLRQAREEIVLFEKGVKEEVQSGGTIIDISTFTDPQNLRQAYGLLNAENARLQKESELRREEGSIGLRNFKPTRRLADIFAMMGGFASILVGAGFLGRSRKPQPVQSN